MIVLSQFYETPRWDDNISNVTQKRLKTLRIHLPFRMKAQVYNLPDMCSWR